MHSSFSHKMLYLDRSIKILQLSIDLMDEAKTWMQPALPAFDLDFGLCSFFFLTFRLLCFYSVYMSRIILNISFFPFSFDL